MPPEIRFRLPDAGSGSKFVRHRLSRESTAYTQSTYTRLDRYNCKVGEVIVLHSIQNNIGRPVVETSDGMFGDGRVSRSYIVKEGGFRDPIEDAVKNVGKSAEVSKPPGGWTCWISAR